MRASTYLAIMFVSFVACDVDRRPEYAVVHINKGNDTLQNVSVKYGVFESLCGVLPSNAEKGQSGVKVPVPEQVSVVWKTSDGHDHEQVVSVSGDRPFRELVVTINGTVAEARLR